VRDRVTTSVSLALLLAVLLPATAGARRDDLPTEGRKPDPGATVADATKGIMVRFTCPEYHPDTSDEIVNRQGDGYHVILARAAGVGLDGLLPAPDRVDVRTAIEVDDAPGMCTAAPDDSERGLLPPEPGTYYWQSYRECMTYICPFATEISDTYAVTVTKTVCTVNRAALATARRDLIAARAALRHRRTDARRARVATLQARVTTLRARLGVVYHCNNA
jgi:hypothetical protein